MKKILMGICAASLVTACSHVAPVIVTAPTLVTSQLDAQSTSTLTRGFRDIYMALFTKLDANEDAYLDEYEASTAIDIKDFAKADKDGDGKLSKNEFMAYADGGGLFGFLHQNANSFM